MTMPDEIDVSNAGYVGEQLRSAITPGAAAVVADLTATTFCDSFAVLHLMLAHDKAAANNVPLLFVVPAGAVLRLLELVGARRVLRICPTVTAALAAAADEARLGDSGLSDSRADGTASAGFRGTRPGATTGRRPGIRPHPAGQIPDLAVDGGGHGFTERHGEIEPAT
jgi:anti-sigma B factor antagonist